MANFYETYSIICLETIYQLRLIYLQLAIYLRMNSSVLYNLLLDH